MNSKRIRLFALTGVAAVSTLGAAAALAGTGNNQPGKTWSNPWLGLNDDQKQATVAGAHVAERAWFDSFVKSGSDARLLPRAPIESYAASVDTLGIH